MSEEDNFEVETDFNTEEPIQEEIVDEAEEVVEEDKPELPDGYMSRDDWESAGKDPDEWRSPKTFNDFKSIAEVAKRQSQKIEHLESSHAEDMRNMQIYHNGQLQNQLASLEAQRTEQIELADIDGVRATEQQMNNLQQQQQNIAPDNHLEQARVQLESWWQDAAAKHPARINDINDKLNAVLGRHSDPGAAINELNQYVNTFNPPPQQRAAVTSKARGRTTGRSLQMSDLTKDELAQRAFFDNDKDYLKAVKNIRNTEV